MTEPQKRGITHHLQYCSTRGNLLFRDQNEVFGNAYKAGFQNKPNKLSSRASNHCIFFGD